jgi:ADP-heptose:LPS heptosyltransferase
LLLALARAKRRIAYDFSGGAALLTDVVPDDGSLRHIIDHHATIAGYLCMPMKAEERIPVLAFGEETRAHASSAPLIGFHFGASMRLRRMPVEEAYALLLSFAGENSRLILVDAPDTRALNSTLLERLPASYSGRVRRWEGDLRELAQMLRTLDKFYAMDSGPAHLAGALGIDTTVFFGPQLSRGVRPMGRKISIVEREDVACRPCDQQRCTNAHHQECLTQLVQASTASPMRRALSSEDQ